MPHLITVRFLRGKVLRQQQNHRCQQTFCRVVEVGILATVCVIALRVDDGFGEDLRVLFCFCFCADVPGIFPVLVHIAVDQGEQVVAIRPGGFPEIHHGYPVSVDISGNGAIVPGQVSLGIQCQKAHPAGTGIFQIWVQEERGFTRAGCRDHQHMDIV